MYSWSLERHPDSAPNHLGILCLTRSAPDSGPNLKPVGLFPPRRMSEECHQGSWWGQNGERPGRRLWQACSQPTGSSPTGAGGQVHQHTEATQASNLDVGRVGEGCRRAELGVIGLGLHSGGWEKSSLLSPDLMAKHSLPALQVTPGPICNISRFQHRAVGPQLNLNAHPFLHKHQNLPSLLWISED